MVIIWLVIYAHFEKLLTLLNFTRTRSRKLGKLEIPLSTRQTLKKPSRHAHLFIEAIEAAEIIDIDIMII